MLSNISLALMLSVGAKTALLIASGVIFAVSVTLLIIECIGKKKHIKIKTQTENK